MSVQLKDVPDSSHFIFDGNLYFLAARDESSEVVAAQPVNPSCPGAAPAEVLPFDSWVQLVPWSYVKRWLMDTSATNRIDSRTGRARAHY